MGYFKKCRFKPLAGLGLLSWNPQDNIQAIRALGGSGQYNDHTEFEGTELLSFVPGRVWQNAKSFGVQKGHFFLGVWWTKKHTTFLILNVFSLGGWRKMHDVYISWHLISRYSTWLDLESLTCKKLQIFLPTRNSPNEPIYHLTWPLKKVGFPSVYRENPTKSSVLYRENSIPTTKNQPFRCDRSLTYLWNRPLDPLGI